MQEYIISAILQMFTPLQIVYVNIHNRGKRYTQSLGKTSKHDGIMLHFAHVNYKCREKLTYPCLRVLISNLQYLKCYIWNHLLIIVSLVELISSKHFMQNYKSS